MLILMGVVFLDLPRLCKSLTNIFSYIVHNFEIAYNGRVIKAPNQSGSGINARSPMSWPPHLANFWNK